MKTSNKLNGFSKVLALALIPTASHAQDPISMWYHGANNEVEKALLEQIITDFNTSQISYEVTLDSISENSYNASVESAALSGGLPCLLDVDGPIMPRWAWTGYLQPLPIDDAVVANFFPGTIGYYDRSLYSIGLWDAATAMITRRSILNAHNIRIPTLDAPWTTDEFTDALATLKASGKFDYPLDLGINQDGEWYPYAFSPFLQSFGGDIFDRTDYRTATGALNGPEAMAFGAWWQDLFVQGYVHGRDQQKEDRDTGFVEGRYAITFNGNWTALGALEKFGDDILFLPNVDLGNGPKIGASSWQFGISSSCPHVEGAADFIEFAIQDQYLTAFSDEIGLIPSTAKAGVNSRYYSSGGDMEVFVKLTEAQSLVRPVTPAYLASSPIFEDALKRIAEGQEVEATLNAAADAINANIAANGNYLEAKRCNEVVQKDGRWVLQRCSASQGANQ